MSNGGIMYEIETEDIVNAQNKSEEAMSKPVSYTHLDVYKRQ